MQKEAKEREEEMELYRKLHAKYGSIDSWHSKM